MYTNYNLNADEIEDAISSINTAIKLKMIEEMLGKENIEHLKNDFSCLILSRDLDYESYNCIETSELKYISLDAIFKNSYNIEIVDISEKNGDLILDDIYYEFKIDKDNRYTKKGIEEYLGGGYSILELYTEDIKKAIMIGELDHNINLFDNILAIADNVCISGSELEEKSTIDLNNKSIRILLSNDSIYMIEELFLELLNLELYCRNIVRRYENVK